MRKIDGNYKNFERYWKVQRHKRIYSKHDVQTSAELYYGQCFKSDIFVTVFI